MLKRCIVANFLLASVLIAIPPFKDTYQKPPDIPNLPPKAFITKYAVEYGISENTMLKIAKCESGLKPNAINYNDGGKGKHSVGIMQFQRSTFDYWSSKLGEKLDYYSYHDQIKLASYMVSEGQARQWTCARLQGLV